MPSASHEVLVAVLREHPAWLAPLIAATGGGTLPSDLIVVDSAVRFAPPAEVRPDLLFTQANRGAWVAVEVQLQPDDVKARRWPLLAAVLHDAHGVMGDLIVLTAQRRVARWATRVSRAKGPLGTQLVFAPRVVELSAEHLDVLLDPARPELAFFAAWAIQQREGPAARRVVQRALELTATMPAELRSAQAHAILSVLSERMLSRLLEDPTMYDSIPESPALRAWREKFEARAEARALLHVLAARGIAVDDAARTRIERCTDQTQLDAWVQRAATATSLEQVFAPA